MKFTLYTANCTGVKTNCVYPNKIEVTDKDDLLEAIKHDHVCARYVQNYRNKDNFIEADGIFMDNDNDHSENPDDWLNAQQLSELFFEVDHAIVPSRHNMRAKEGKSARPRQHIYFPIKPVRDMASYTMLKDAIQKAYPFLDDNAKDAARFFFGTKAKEEDVIWNEGWLTIDEYVEDFTVDTDATTADEKSAGILNGSIPEGCRNKTMSLFAGKVLKRFGDCEKAKEVYLEHSHKCDPPLEMEELETIWGSAVKFFHKKIVTSQEYVSPDEYNDEFGAASLKPEDYSDIGEAKVLVREYGNELRYTNATDYLRFDGECWREDRQMVIGAAEEFLDLQLVDAMDSLHSAIDALKHAGISEQIIYTGGKALEKECDTSELEELFAKLISAQTYRKFVMRYRNYKNIVNVQNTAKPMLSISASVLDKDPFLLNTPDATYDMSKGIDGRKEHDPKDLITKITEKSPGEEGKQLWEDALKLFFCNDQELIDYVQMTVGEAAVGKVYQEHLIIAYGGGANGKSTFWNTIYRVLGSYAGKISADALTMNCKRNVKPEMAELKGKRLIIASEMEEGMRLNTSIVKQLCSTDEIQGEKKYKDPFAFVPSHTLVLYTNYLPKVGANDDGIWRRLVVVPFNAKITGKSDIKNYADYLFDKAGSYIMSWIIEGACKAIDVDFRIEEPQIVKDAISAYRENNNWLGQFLEECCEISPSLTERSGEIYQTYRAYCITNGESIRSTTDFYNAMDKAGFVRRRTNKGSMVWGLSLKEGQDFIL